MTKRRRKLARTPEEQAEEVRQRAIRKAEVDALKATGATVIHDEQYRVRAAYRMDVFALLHSRKTGEERKPSLTEEQYRSVRRLEHLIAVAFGHEKPEVSLERVDQQTSGRSERITQAMIIASGLLKRVLAKIGLQDARLLCALLSGTNDRLGAKWNDTVQRVTGETNVMAQGAAIRSACSNLALAWQAIDYEERAA